MIKKIEDKDIEDKDKPLSFKQRKELLELNHKYKMEELFYLRESDKIHHERELERGRIKSSEIRKTLWQKEALRN